MQCEKTFSNLGQYVAWS